MSAAPFTVEMIFVFLLTLCLLHQYGNWRKQHWLVTTAVFVAWYFSFLIVFILPLDVSAVSRDHFPNLSCIKELLSVSVRWKMFDQILYMRIGSFVALMLYVSLSLVLSFTYNFRDRSFVE